MGPRSSGRNNLPRPWGTRQDGELNLKDLFHVEHGLVGNTLFHVEQTSRS